MLVLNYPRRALSFPLLHVANEDQDLLLPPRYKSSNYRQIAFCRQSVVCCVLVLFFFFFFSLSLFSFFVFLFSSADDYYLTRNGTERGNGAREGYCFLGTILIFNSVPLLLLLFPSKIIAGKARGKKAGFRRLFPL